MKNLLKNKSPATSDNSVNSEYSTLLKTYAEKNISEYAKNNNFSEEEKNSFEKYMFKYVNSINKNNAEKTYLNVIDKIFNYKPNKRFAYEAKEEKILSKSKSAEEEQSDVDKNCDDKTSQLVDIIIDTLFEKSKEENMNKEEVDFKNIITVKNDRYLIKTAEFEISIVKGFKKISKKTGKPVIIVADKLFLGTDNKFYYHLDDRTKKVFDVCEVKDFIKIQCFKKDKNSNTLINGPVLFKDMPDKINFKDSKQIEIFKATCALIGNKWKF